MLFNLLVYLFFIPPCLLITFRAWRSGDTFLTIILALAFLPLIAVALLACHGKREQELPEAGQGYGQTVPAPDMTPYLETMLEPHERITYSARVQRDAVNEMVKKMGVALLLAGPLGTLCWSHYLDLEIFSETVVQLCGTAWFFIFISLIFRYALGNPANEKPGCVVTNRRIIFKDWCCSGSFGDRDFPEFDVLSSIPLDNVREVLVRKNWLFRQQDIGSVQVRCVDPAFIRRVACADFPLRPGDRRKIGRCPKPLHYVQYPDVLRQHIESAVRRHRL